MKAVERGEGGGRRLCGIAVAKPAAAPVSGLAIALAAALAGGCSTSIQTPLPEIKPAASTSLSQEERQKAVDELNKKRATHEQDAEQQIEQSR